MTIRLFHERNGLKEQLKEISKKTSDPIAQKGIDAINKKLNSFGQLLTVIVEQTGISTDFILPEFKPVDVELCELDPKTFPPEEE